MQLPADYSIDGICAACGRAIYNIDDSLPYRRAAVSRALLRYLGVRAARRHSSPISVRCVSTLRYSRCR